MPSDSMLFLNAIFSRLLRDRSEAFDAPSAAGMGSGAGSGDMGTGNGGLWKASRLGQTVSRIESIRSVFGNKER
jgi:hypothetical protein